MMGDNFVQVGLLGETPVIANLTPHGCDVAVKVLLTAPYTLLSPPGYLQRPQWTGSEHQQPLSVSAGATVAFWRPEANAIVAAGGATYA